MPDTAVDAPPSSALPPRLALIVPLALERNCLVSGPLLQCGADVEVLQCGQGELNARRAAQSAVRHGASALLSVGVAGALAPGLHAGDAVVPAAVVAAPSGRRTDCSAQWSRMLRAHIEGQCRVSDGALLSVPDVLSTPAAKRSAAGQYDAVACDMESAAIAAVASDTGVHFAALRVISDTAADELPDDVAGWVDEAGNAKLLPVLSALLSPSRWRSVMTMNRRFQSARRSLRQLSHSLAAAAYCCPQR